MAYLPDYSNLTPGTYTVHIGTSARPEWIDGASIALPAQAGNNGLALTTNGTSASWADAQTLALPAQVGNIGFVLSTNGLAATWIYLDINGNLGSSLPAQFGNAGMFLQTNGASSLWASPYPVQAGQTGNFLMTNGTAVSWVPSLPAQAGNAGKILSTNGSTAAWTASPGGLPSQTGNNGLFLTTDGTTALWSPPTTSSLLGCYPDFWEISSQGSVTGDTGVNLWNGLGKIASFRLGSGGGGATEISGVWFICRAPQRLCIPRIGTFTSRVVIGGGRIFWVMQYQYSGVGTMTWGALMMGFMKYPFTGDYSYAALTDWQNAKNAAFVQATGANLTITQSGSTTTVAYATNPFTALPVITGSQLMGIVLDSAGNVTVYFWDASGVAIGQTVTTPWATCFPSLLGYEITPSFMMDARVSDPTMYVGNSSASFMTPTVLGNMGFNAGSDLNFFA